MIGRDLSGSGDSVVQVAAFDDLVICCLSCLDQWGLTILANNADFAKGRKSHAVFSTLFRKIDRCIESAILSKISLLCSGEGEGDLHIAIEDAWTFGASSG